MKISKKLLVITIILLSITVVNNIFAQMDNFVQEDCPMTNISTYLPVPYKPINTGNFEFRIIIVYVMFDNESYDIDNQEWPANTTNGPSYKGTMLAEQKNNINDWWNSYNSNTQSLSSWFCEVSKGTMHVVGKEFFVKLDYDVAYYQEPGRGESEVNKDIYTKLSSQNINWPIYDNWEYHTNGTITQNPDGVIDMIYKVHRFKYSNIFSEGPYSGFAYLGYAYNQLHYLVDPVNDKYVYGGFPDYFPNEIKGSGLSIFGTSVYGILTKAGVIGRIWHEHGHYTFGIGHGKIGLMGDVWDPFMNPFEQINVNYVTPYYSNVPFEQVVLDDYSARNTSHKYVLRVQLPSSEILIVNRNKISKWDRPMLGDTAYGDIFKETNYGSGIYFYHITGLGLPSYTSQDVECSDGLWNWIQDGYDAPDWDPNNAWLPVLKRTIPIRDVNDNGSSVNVNQYPNTVKDGLTIQGYNNNQTSSQSKWFSIGKKKTQNSDGIDRIFTNQEENWTSRENQIDRWDAWVEGEIFSPYSSPSTMTWGNEISGVFIWIEKIDVASKEATINVYRNILQNPNNGWDELDILYATPPSKPMGIKIDKTECVDGRRYPIITWTHNTEPDMLQGSPQPFYKRYKIFRAWDEINIVPGNFVEIDDLLIHKDVDPSYIDINTYGQCDYGTPEVRHRIRYKIKAVDNTERNSVYSDFVSISTYYLNRGGDSSPNPILENNNIPKLYELSQNYPNPFNPTTTIKYAIPKDEFVTIIIYDITGREIIKLVNEQKQAGFYSVLFDGNNLSSGVYFYRIEAGNFVQVKKMLLIK
jgi:hypothetical protein